MKKILLFSSLLALMSTDTDAQVQRKCVMEDFGSITCPPCYTFAQWFDPWEKAKKANDESSDLVLIKYQMNWPGRGDSSFNNDGYNRRVYYNVTGIPTFNVNGTKTSAGSGSIDNIYANCSSGMSDLAIEGTYTIKGDSLLYNVTITPSANISGAHTIHIGATEEHYYITGGTNQNDYTNIMRKMFPNGNGTPVASFTSGQPVTVKGGYKFTVSALPKQGSYDFWGNPYDGHLVVFVQNNSTKEILQGEAFRPQWAADVKEVSNLHHTSIYPNPANNEVAVIFGLNKPTEVSMFITDALGRKVYTRATQSFETGKNRMALPTTNFATGTYFVTLVASDGTQKTLPLTIAK